MTKEKLRKQVKSAQSRLRPEVAQIHSQAICEAVAGLPEFARARSVALYLALPGEVSTGDLLKRSRTEGKRIALPCFAGGEWGFSWLTSEVFDPGPWNTRQPHPIIPVSPGELDLLLIPCVAVDTAGGRVGHGKGIYDRLLRDTRGPAIGLAFEFQVFTSIPLEPHDRRLDKVVTERRIMGRPEEKPAR